MNLSEQSKVPFNETRDRDDTLKAIRKVKAGMMGIGDDKYDT